MTKAVALLKVKKVLSEAMKNHGEAIIVTANQENHPHASWMGSLSSPGIGTILTITSPDSRKIVNILENPKVEWMFTTRERDEVVYLRGVAHIISEMDEIERAWSSIKNKSRAFFLSYMKNPGIQFLVVKTKVSEMEYNLPRENYHKVIKPPFR